ncbi:MAG TPA: PQQ-binding-like beta-propeller repeat protein, partial [Gemmataceae bacterium]|nr:PQQ-binding-like beta-propeller repeat protein [Gemmataceae bacterium]
GVTAEELPAKLTELWQFKVKAGMDGSPCVAGGVAFVTGQDGHIHAVDVATGKRKWKTEIGPSKASPAVKGESVYIGSEDGKFRRLDTATGREMWAFDTGGEITAAANFHGETILIPSHSGKLFALDRTGKKLWQYSADQPIYGSVAVMFGFAYLAGCDSKLHALDADNGERTDTFDLGGQTGVTPAMDGGVFVGTMANEFWAVDREGNPAGKPMRKLWSFKPPKGNGFQGSAAVTADVVVIGSDAGRVWGLDRVTGRPKWEFAAKGDFHASPVVAGNRVYAPSDRTLYVLDLATGKKVRELRLDGEVRGSPAVAGGCVFVATDNGTLYCFGSKD